MPFLNIIFIFTKVKHLFNKSLFSAYYVLSIVLGSGNTEKRSRPQWDYVLIWEDRQETKRISKIPTMSDDGRAVEQEGREGV